MGDTFAATVEAEILAELGATTQPLDMDRLIAKVRETDRAARAVDVKIAAFNLVSRGKVGLNDQWQLSTAASK